MQDKNVVVPVYNQSRNMVRFPVNETYSCTLTDQTFAKRDRPTDPVRQKLIKRGHLIAGPGSTHTKRNLRPYAGAGQTQIPTFMISNPDDGAGRKDRIDEVGGFQIILVEPWMTATRQTRSIFFEIDHQQRSHLPVVKQPLMVPGTSKISTGVSGFHQRICCLDPELPQTGEHLREGLCMVRSS